MIFRSLFFLLVLFGATLALAGFAAQDAVKPAKVPSVDELIRALKSPNFKTREEATSALLKRQQAEEYLRKALTTEKNPEARNRIVEILKHLERPAVQQRLQTLSKRIREGRVDEFVDQMTALADQVKDEQWKLALELAQKLVIQAKKEASNSQYARMPKMALPPKYAPMLLATKKPVPFSAQSVFGGALVVSQGPITAKSTFIRDTIVFANGDFSAKIIFHSIIVCDGNVRAESMSHSLIIATGEIRGNDALCHLIENASQPLGVVRFFRTSEWGIAVAGEAKNQVFVTKILPKGPLAGSGIRPGDRILEINGVQVKSQEVFRSELRRLIVSDQEITVAVERDGRKEIILLKLANGAKVSK